MGALLNAKQDCAEVLPYNTSHGVLHCIFALLYFCILFGLHHKLSDTYSHGRSSHITTGLPTDTVANQTILSKIPKRYRNFCQGLGQIWVNR